MSYEAAAVLPLALSTAACGLFAKDQLGLSRPSATPEDQGQTVLVWGGSTSVGCSAIQLAKAAGYRVIATASPGNFDYLERLGADGVVDYAGQDAVGRVVRALRGHDVAGALAIGAGSAQACIEVLGASASTRKLAMATFPRSISMPCRTGRAPSAHDPDAAPRGRKDGRYLGRGKATGRSALDHLEDGADGH